MSSLPSIPLHRIGEAEHLLAHLEDLEGQLSRVRKHLTHFHRLTTLGTLAATVAHEYNNILTPVVSYAQMALASPDDVKQMRKALEKVLEAAERATRMSGSVLGFARVANEPLQADLCQTVNDAVTTLGRDPRKDGIELTMDIPEGIRVAMEPVSLQQVLLNLLLNARKAMRRTGGRLSVIARALRLEDDHAAGRVHIEVRDDGPGVSDAMMRRLFEPFVTESIEASEPLGVSMTEKGTGLGLYICRDLICTAGGSITVESIAAPHPNHGAVFHIELPMAIEIAST